MKYQIYLQKDVSTIVNLIAEGLNKKPSQLIKELIESNFRNAYKDTLKVMAQEDKEAMERYDKIAKAIR